ncbi:ABC transporter ATP-binding protein [Leekyejoonella antrihumi]|uniref:ABC transporter ATP-binding protein n=1 Tax=Leekyejoonella antrihumi TaxID=1660198 RepID=A0A563DUQ3_9MICO|nr:ABC transporter ATP-binding protein [Leekyejoonella antrihumi]TWP33691.1 ABC transporter ATP-binding protein [Leekyejoonella antrihumi]
MNTEEGAARDLATHLHPDDAGDRSGAALLHVERLNVAVGPVRRARPLVRDVSFDVHRGQALGIVGESGSGKSLTARAVVGLLPAGLHASGSVTFDGHQLIDAERRTWRALRGSRVSLLLQDPFTMLNPLQTAGAHLAESLPRGGHHSRSRQRDEIARRLGEVGLAAEVAEQYPFQLSGGMRQRVALAVALARDPELLIADEPTTALDVTTQAEVLELLQSIRRSRGMSLILITHDLRVAFSVCDRVQVMYAGSVLEQSPTAALAADPAHPYSLGLLLADPPVTHYVAELTAIPGSVPQADTVADTCAFAARCSWAQPECAAARPPLAPVGPNRTSACLRLGEIHPELRAALSHLDQPAAPPPALTVGDPIAAITELRKTFHTSRLAGRARRTTALDGVSLQIGEGESVGLVGETGSGKTTIARALLGLITPDAGRIDLAGIDISNYRRLDRRQRRQARRIVQAVFQDPYTSLNPALSIGTTLREVLDLRGDVTDSRHETADLLGLVGLPASYAQRRPVALSGGERQRVAIARAIALRPRLLICDEPVAALDVSAQAQVLELLRDIHRRYNTSMLFITHDLSVVRQMADRIIVLYHGQVVETGDTATVLDSPNHPYTRRLINAIPSAQAPSGHAPDRSEP